MFEFIKFGVAGVCIFAGLVAVTKVAERAGDAVANAAFGETPRARLERLTAAAAADQLEPAKPAPKKTSGKKEVEAAA